MKLRQADVEYLRETCRLAGAEILVVYESDFAVERKDDRSPLTEADLRSHAVIERRLRARWPELPVLSEESAEEFPYEVRSGWTMFWLVDPLDGTKEFIQRNGQFTVNIALIENGRPVAGFVYAPAAGRMFDATIGAGEPATAPAAPSDTLRIVGSRSHHSPEMDAFVEEQRRRYANVEFIPMGSSLKICLVAEGKADIYPRFGPTMEWDTAAAHAVANAAGRRVVRYGSDEELTYNKPDLHNPWFVVR
jgi:3'(2'), 5'-bisphosphate nucleotidase